MIAEAVKVRLIVSLRAPASDCGRLACASMVVASISVPRLISISCASNRRNDSQSTKGVC